MDTDNLTATAVREAMESAGITQLTLSEQTGIPRTTLLRRLAGHGSFTIAELHSVSAVLDVPLTTLIPEQVA